MCNKNVAVLSAVKALAITKDARMVALRWDVISWCLVLDCDAPLEEETANTPIRRVWLVFIGMDEITCSFDDARLPNGIFFSNYMEVSKCEDGFCEYQIPLIAPSFTVDGQMRKSPHGKMTIKAKGLVAAASILSSRFGESGPNREQRAALATEEDFLQCFGDVWARVRKLPKS